MSTISRRTKWHPPPPTPKILHFQRSRRSRRRPTTHHHDRSKHLLPPNLRYISPARGHLENLFNQESDTSERRDRVEEDGYDGGSTNGFEKEKWMFQAEILRAECNFLRMEREFALKKLERNRVKMEKTLRSAVHTLVSGRKKIAEGKNVNTVLEKEIEDLSTKLEELQKGSRIKDNEVHKCSNFDKKASIIQRRLEKQGQNCLNESQIQDTADKSINNEVDELRKKSSFASSASDSKGIDSTFSTRQLYQEPVLHEDNRCSGRCKVVVQRIVEQVRAETEQWSQMQEMLGKVRGEMEELQASRDFWENRAHNADYEIRSLKHAVEEWKEKANGYELKANELQLQVSLLKEEIIKSKAELNYKQKREMDLILSPQQEQLEKEKDEQPLSLGKQIAKEKRMLHRSLKETRHAIEKEKMCTNSIVARKRSPLKDIGNSSSLARQNGAVFPFDSPERQRV